MLPNTFLVARAMLTSTSKTVTEIMLLIWHQDLIKEVSTMIGSLLKLQHNLQKPYHY